ncbi:hypothetical protein [Halomonas alkaliantarctica]|uniref:hypothetical protein n=1 Tax=Halomonas alkaliantarctica TaxID=232346 RepID=UPI00265A6EE5|nr:hypothetical protein [Halomonas alkaliantarctica]
MKIIPLALEKLVLGEVLSDESRQQLEDWMKGNAIAGNAANDPTSLSAYQAVAEYVMENTQP